MRASVYPTPPTNSATSRAAHRLSTSARSTMVNDAWFYAVHRLLHRDWLFKKVHSVHHRSVATNPFTWYSFHPAEGLLLTAWLVPAVLLFAVPLPVLTAMHVLGLLNNVNAHLRYELQPKSFIRVPPFS